ncbi:MAG TPA: electron transport complex subunit E [bacterium]|nr:electron transport complex subunit E [bacterium]
MRFYQEFIKGLWKEIPPFKLVLGLCPTLAVTAAAANGFFMGMATTFVLVCSNVLISMLRKVIPSKVRIAAYILVIASFVVIVEMMMKAYVFPFYQILGIFIPLIVVNCIILGRAEAFAAKNGVLYSFADGLGIGIGFTISLTFLGAVRELFGAGKIFDHAIMPASYMPFEFMIKAPGAFVCLGVILGLMSLVGKK